MSNANIDAAKKLRLTRVKKYQKYPGQVKMELNLAVLLNFSTGNICETFIKIIQQKSRPKNKH